MKNTTEEMYFRPNGAQLTDKVDIEADKTLRRKDILRNAELGRINEAGRYIIPAAVLKELLFMTKYIFREDYETVLKESKDTFEFKSRGFLPVFGAVEFRLVINEKIAKLFIFENVYREFNGYQEIYGEQISECACDGSKDEFIEKLFTLYNFKVVEEEDLEGKRPEDLADSEDKIHAIMFTKIYLNMISKDYLKVSANDEKETFDDLVGMLKEQGGDYGKKVLRHFIDRIEKRPDIMQIKDEEGYNESLNDMLIGAIEVATTEDDIKDPGIEELYRRVYQRRYEKTDDHMKEAQLGVKIALAEQVTDKILGSKMSTQEAAIDSFLDMLGTKPNETKVATNISEQGRNALEEIAKPILKQPSRTQASQETAAAAEAQAAADKQGTNQQTAEVKPAEVKPTEVKPAPAAKKPETKPADKPSDIWKYKLAQTFVPVKPGKSKPADQKKSTGGPPKLTTPQVNNQSPTQGNSVEAIRARRIDKGQSSTLARPSPTVVQSASANFIATSSSVQDNSSGYEAPKTGAPAKEVASTDYSTNVAGFGGNKDISGTAVEENVDDQKYVGIKKDTTAENQITAAKNHENGLPSKAPEERTLEL